MPRSRSAPTINNPFALTIKQDSYIALMVADVLHGRGLNPQDSYGKVYPSKYKQGTLKHRKVVSNSYTRPFKNDRFRNALLAGLTDAGILGYEGKVGKRLMEGLDAENSTVLRALKGSKEKDEIVSTPNLGVRLDYIKEINKLTGAYAPEKHETKRFNLNVETTQEELDKKIKKLNRELRGT